ncbi:MAG: PPC domain-containing protein [Planctomycetota bacterium]
MSHRPFAIFFLFAVFAFKNAYAENDPYIGYIYPAGGQQGDAFTVIIGGQRFGENFEVQISGVGVKAIALEHETAPNPEMMKEMTQQFRELAKAQMDDMDDEETGCSEMDDIIRQVGLNEKRKFNPAISENLHVLISIDKDAPSGNRELRLVVRNKLSNPMIFQVGQFPEVRKPTPQPALNAIQARKSFDDPAVRIPMTPMDVTLPVVLNGQILPGDIDRYRFVAQRGQRIAIVVNAQSLIPYISDAVPGWFQAVVTLYDSAGQEVAYSDDDQFKPDPVLLYEIPADGEYQLDIKDSIYRGREDFVYRAAVGELPVITSVFPLGGKVGERINVELRGWNLPIKTLALNDLTGGVRWLSVGDPGIRRVAFIADDLPYLFESEPNDSMAAAQPVEYPLAINGRIAKPGNIDIFQFDGVAGQTVEIEVKARRLGSPLDSILKLTTSSGEILALNDDYNDRTAGLTVHQADSLITATFPNDGQYYVIIGDAQKKGGDAYAYRLYIREALPDYDLLASPSSINLYAGASAPVTMYAFRKNGFTGDVRLHLKDAPKGFSLSPDYVPAGQERVRITLNAPVGKTNGIVDISIEGEALVDGRKIIHSASPVDDRMQAFGNRHLVPAQSLQASVIRRPKATSAARIESATPVRIPAGGTAAVKVQMPVDPRADAIAFDLYEPPDGFSVRTVSPLEFTIETDAAVVKPGQTVFLIVIVYDVRDKQKPDAPPNPKRFELGYLPAFAITVTTPAE